MIKQYVEAGIYHVYNRGVEKRLIFLNPTEYQRFTDYFDIYLGTEGRKNRAGTLYPKLSEKVELLAFCLMPNHFHLLIRQKTADGLTDFMHRIMTGYAMYFNLQYKRVGPLYQGTYKAALINNNPYALDVSRYIHLNPNPRDFEESLNYPYSSLRLYGNGLTPPWLSTSFILESFGGIDNYVDYCKGRAVFQEDQPLERQGVKKLASPATFHL